MNDYDVTIAPLAERISELENSTTQLMNVLGVERTYTGEIRTHRLEDIEKHIDNLTDRLTRIDTIAIGQSKRIGELEELLRNIVRVLDIEKTEAESEIDGAIFSSYSSKVIGEIFDRIISLEHKAARSTVQEPIREHTDWEQRRYEIAKTLFATYAFSCSKPVKKAIEKADQLIEQLKDNDR
jgi:hypothetical protein